MTTAPPLDTSALSDAALEWARVQRDRANAAEVAAIVNAVTFCSLNGPESIGEAATLDFLTDVPLAGEGTPTVSQTAVAEFAAAMAMSPGAARVYLADALELAHRLPLVWERVRAGEVPVFRARMIAQRTHSLPAAGAAQVDRQIAPIAHEVGPVRLVGLVDAARTLFDPEDARARAEAAAEARGVRVFADQPGHGVVDVVASVDYADALDLEAALSSVATELREAGDDSSLDVRRSKAIGVLARRQLGGGRQVQVYVHLSDAEAAAGMASVEGSPALVALDRLREWTTVAGTTVRVTPVVDLNEELSRDGYTPTGAQREQAVLINQTCVHPYCTRSARRADIDHIEAYAAGGRTTSRNLAPLCRPHHRLKTHGGWTYEPLGPGRYRWRSPTGRSYLTDRHGTTASPGP